MLKRVGLQLGFRTDPKSIDFTAHRNDIVLRHSVGCSSIITEKAKGGKGELEGNAITNDFNGYKGTS